MDIDELKEQIHLLFNPEPEDDGHFLREYPHSRLKEFHHLDFSYMDSPTWEGSSVHRYTRLCASDEHEFHQLTRNSDMPKRLMSSALQLFGDSVIAYHESEERESEIRYYPPIILTFWSGFETFVRYSSELLLLTVPDIPELVANYLQECETYVDPKGSLKTRPKRQSVLNRYTVLMSYAYNHEIDKGNKFWQGLKRAKQLRDYYTHLDINEPRAISTHELIDFMEAVLLALIWPSSVLQRTLLLGQYDLHQIWSELSEYAQEFTERPFFLNWYLKEPSQFHCNFERVDVSRFPSMHDEDYGERFRAVVDKYRRDHPDD